MTSTEPDDDSPRVSGSPSPIIFLDTNAVHYTRLALAFAKNKKLEILKSSFISFRSAMNASKSHKNAIGGILSGYQIAHYLAKQSKDADARVQYAPVSGFELLCGGLRGRAILNAARCGVPNRWYSKLDEAELLLHLGDKDFRYNHSYHSKLSSLFQDQLGSPILESKESDLGRVFDLAQTILGAMYLELGDCLVYASALLARASEVITIDGHFSRVIMGVENLGGAAKEYRLQCGSARKLIQSKLADLLGIKERYVIFPKAVGNAQLKVKAVTGAPRD